MSEKGSEDFISLCQPDQHKSCGACCGLYNWKDHSRAAVTSLLRERTAIFLSSPPPSPRPSPLHGKGGDGDPLASVPRETGNLHEYRRLGEALSPGHKLLEEIYNCEFLGFLDQQERRVGCLLHPSRHDGADLRDLCLYGKELCAGHFCPSFTHLTRMEQVAVIRALDDWYLYGLVITDIDFVKEFLRAAQDRLGDTLRMEHLMDAGVQAALRAFLVLKESWEFAATDNRLGKYYFSHSEYRIARLEYEKRWKIGPSRYDKILVSLSSEFETKAHVVEAEFMIEERIEAFVQACRGAPP